MTNKTNSNAAFDREALYQQLLQVARIPSEDEGEHFTTEEIFDYAFERLPLKEVDRIDVHLDSFCDVCMDDMEQVLEVVSPWVAEISATPELLASLEARLIDPIWNVRLSTAAMIAAIGPLAATPGVLKGLLSMIRDERAWVRDGADEAFSQLGDAANTPAMQEALNSLLDDSDSDIRIVARRVARHIRGPETADTRSEVAASTGDDVGLEDQRPRGVLRYRANVDRLTALTARLSNSEDLEREAIVQTIAALGAAAAEPSFVLSLVQLMSRSESEDIRYAAAEAIQAIGPAAAWPEVLCVLVDDLQNQNADIRDEIVQTLLGLGLAAMTEPVLEVLTPLVCGAGSTKPARLVFSRIIVALSSTARLASSAVRASVDEILERIPALLTFSIAPMAAHQADGGDHIEGGTISDGRIRYRIDWDRKSGDVLFRFDTNADELDNALIFLTRSPSDSEELSAVDNKFWFVLLERIGEGEVSGRLQIKKDELPAMTGTSEITVRVIN